MNNSSVRIRRRIRAERVCDTRTCTSTRCVQRRREYRVDDGVHGAMERMQGRRNGLAVMAMSSLMLVMQHHPQRAIARAASDDGKRTGLSTEEIRAILAEDLALRQYFVTGNLTQTIWRDDAVFADPTNKTVGLQKYVSVVRQLFDAQCSAVQLLDISIVSPTQVRARWTLRGVLKLPWRPRVSEFQGTSLYDIDEDGLINKQTEEWSVSPVEALLETVTPGAGKSC